MRPHRTPSCSPLLFVLLCLWLTLDIHGAAAQCPHTGTVVVNDVSNAKGKPFQAKTIQTIVTYDKNDQKHAAVVKYNLFRDSEGRMRAEQFFRWDS